MRARSGTAAALGLLSIIAAGTACEARNLGASPPGDQFFFPAGVLLDPFYEPPPPDGLTLDPPDLDAVVLPEIQPDVPGPRFLYVSNGNNDRTYNAGSLMAIDLDAFWNAWYEPYPEGEQACVDLRGVAEAAIAATPAEAQAIEDQVTSGLLDRDEADLLLQQLYDDLRATVSRAREACDPRRGRLDPYCSDDRCVLPPGSDVTADQPCRRLPLLPHIVECNETPFVANRVHVGDFSTTLASSIETDGSGERFARLWLPVRGDPSITYVDVRRQGDDDLSMECEQGDDPLDPDLCGDAHRLDRLRSNPDLDPLEREPFNTLVWERQEPSTDPEARGQRLAFVAHADGAQLSMVDLDGVRGGTEPAIVDLAPLYAIGVGAAGGFGLAARPCFEVGQGPLGELDPAANVPALTQGCTRPLVYTSMRFAGQLISFTASGLEIGGVVEDRLMAAEDRVDCSVPGLRPECSVESTSDDYGQIVCDRQQSLETCCASVQGDYDGNGVVDEGDNAGWREACDALPSVPCCEGTDPDCATDCSDGGCAEDSYAGPYCATPDQLGQACAVQCEPQVRGTRRIQPSLLLDSSLTSAPILGDMAFADPRGDQLLVLQTNPGALLSLDTSLTEDGEPLDIPSAPPVEICAEPSRMKIYTERDEAGRPLQRYALVTCFRAALVYVVDLEALRVVDAIVVGTGPHDIAIDDAREVAYVINNLEFSISVVDLSRRRSTRFQELARLGLQDPFSQ